MLLVWLMSLGIGVANACLVKTDQGWHKHLSHSHTGIAPDNFAKVHVDAGENDKSPQTMACLNFCAAEQNTLVNDHADGLASLDIGPVLFLTWLLVPATDQTYQPQAFGGPTWSEQPIYIRYLRLTI
jgi:hypothetical protein